MRWASTGCLAVAAGLGPGSEAAHGQVTDLVVTESGDDAVLSWSTGTPLWRVLRSETPNFFYGNRVLAQGLGSPSFTDVGALEGSRPSYFYMVLEQGQPDPPGFELNPPPPVPFISSLTPDSGAPGDLVTVAGDDFAADGAAMHVSLGGFFADILASSETELTIEVPDGAVTGDVQVCRGIVCSNRVRFTVTFGPAFEDLSSIAFEPGTGSLWAADRGTADTVYEIDPTGVGSARGSLNQALLGHPSPADGSGRVYYSNSLDSNFNLGSIEYIDSASNSEVFFDSAGQSGGTSTAVRCEGIAATDSEPDVAYFLDGRGSSIRRIVRDALAHDTSYGDQPFSFNSPAGARFDSAGNLYVSATTAIYRILPQ